jgi:hypothetical protein
MDKEEIRKIAEEKINEYVRLTDKAYLRSTDLKYVKLIDNREKPGDVKLKKAWVVRFIDDGKYKDAWEGRAESLINFFITDLHF